MQSFPASFWHGHEMVYGFALAIIAGFLLTASANWTRTRGLHGNKLAFLFFLWLGARLFFLLSLWNGGLSIVAGVLEILFLLDRKFMYVFCDLSILLRFYLLETTGRWQRRIKSRQNFL